MNKTEFIEKLKEGLQRVPVDERVAALQYYTEYLDDAGPDREGEVLAELGSPEAVAATICAESNADGWAPPEKTAPVQPVQNRPRPTAEQAPPPAGGPFNQGPQPQAVPPPFGQAAQPGWAGANPPPHGYASAGPPPPMGGVPGGRPVPPPPAGKNGNRPAFIILIVLACILLSPVIGGLLSAFGGILVALLCILLLPLMVGLSLVAGGILAVVVGSFGFGLSVYTGLTSLGVGILILGLGLLCTYGGVVLLAKVVPSIFRGIAALCRKIFKRKKPAAGPG